METQLTQELWNQRLDELRDAGGFLSTSTHSAESPALAREAVDYLFMTLASAYLLMARNDPDYPEFKPWVGHLLDYAAPNPDATYYYATISGQGVYRIVGKRNDIHWLNFLTGYDFPGFVDTPGKSQTSMSIDELDIAPDGSFEIILSAERPLGHAGNWMKIEPEANYIAVRQFAYHPHEMDARLAIERADGGDNHGVSIAAAAEERVRKTIAHLKTSSRAWPSFPRWLKAYPTNTFNVFPLKNSGEVQGQVYYECLYDIPLDQAMIIEFGLPKPCFYWNIQIDDRFWRTLEFVNRHTSFNGHRDRSDGDGRVRIVVSHHDTGLDNWIDACGVTEGHMLIRFQQVEQKPEATVKLMALAEVDKHLPADTRRVTPTQRAKTLREWALAKQLRRSW